MPRRVPVILQTATSDCGPACLAMVLAALPGRRSGRRGSQGQLARRVREDLDPGRDGVTALDLRDAARRHGLQCRAVKLSTPAVGPDDLRGLPLPLVAHWQGNHFVVVSRVRDERVEVIDPGIGRRWLDASQLAGGATGVVLLFAPGDGGPDPSQDNAPGPLRAVLGPLLARYRWLLLRAALCALALTLLGLVLPAVTARVTDLLAGHRPVTAGWLLLVPVLAVTVGLLALARGLALVQLQRRLGRRLAGDVVGRLFSAAFRYFERRSTGDLVARIDSADLVRSVLATSLSTAVLDALVTAGYLAVLLAADPALAGATAVLLAAQVGPVLRLSLRTRGLRQEELLAQAQAQGRLVSAISGIAAVRVAGGEEHALADWAARYRRQLDAAARRGRVQSFAEAVTATGQLVAPLLLLLVGAATNAGAPGRALGLVALAGAALAPATALPLHLFNLAELGPLVDRLADVLWAPAEQPGPRRTAPRLTGRIELCDVGFRYDPRSPYALRGVSTVVPAGAKVAVVGGSGSGKSTLAKLLTGLHPPSEGSVRFDGYDLAALELRSVRRQLGVVLQEPFLGSGTIREAVTLGRPGTGLDEIRHAATLAAIDDDIMALPLGYDSPIGENGLGLSGGQRQRLALARALLGSPPVLLLDEATSALDVATEARIEDNLRGLPATRIVIAHRLSTVVDADLVLVLEGGRIVERGTPAELVAMGGRFAAMVARQEPARA